MKKLLIVLGIFFSCLKPALAEVKVVATLPVFAALAQEIGGANVSVKTLTKPGQDPHFLDAKPSYVVDLHGADLLIHAGLELEIGWLPPVLLQSRNPKIQTSGPGNLDASQSLNLLDLPTGPVDRSQGDVHPMGNPHYWLDPRNLAALTNRIAEALKKIDPSGAAGYETRAKQFLGQLEQKTRAWSQSASALKGRKILPYHRSLNYLVSWLGLQVVANIEPKPGIPPNSKHVEELVKLLQANAGTVIVSEDYYPSKTPEYLARQTGSKAVTVATQPTELNAAGIFKMFETLLGKLGA